jgi:hypothetical protein
MKTSFLTRLAALLASVAITLVVIDSMANFGHPAPDEGALMARLSSPAPSR